MTTPRGDGPDREARYRDLLFLHAQAPEFRGLDLSVVPGYDEFEIGAALHAVAAAPKDTVPVAERLSVLYDLARAGVPGRSQRVEDFSELARSALVLEEPEPTALAVSNLLDDIQRAADEGRPFATTRSAGAFAHQETAFIGQDVCAVRRVRVGGTRATWIYSEFDTDARMSNVLRWIDPRQWSTLDPLFFARMDLLDAPPAPIGIAPPPNGVEHWRGLFHEDVHLVKLVKTRLLCTHWQDGAAAGMTYDLDKSLDGEIDVDRGFLLVTDHGATRRVQALKIVGFTADVWDALAPLVCPFWTGWLRGAVQGGSSSVPVPATQNPEEESPCTAVLDAWVQFFGDAAVPYVDLLEDVTGRTRARTYATSDLVADATRLWSQLAKDWARAWTGFNDTMQEVSREGLDAGLTPPGVPRDIGRHRTTAAAGTTPTGAGRAVVPAAKLGPAGQPVCSDLVSIAAGTDAIPAAEVTVTVHPMVGGTVEARVWTTNTSAPPGLYVGSLEAPAGRPLAPVHLYVSRATRV